MEVLADMEGKAALARREDAAGKVAQVLTVLVIKADREGAGLAVQVDQRGQEVLDPTVVREVAAEMARTLPSAIPKAITRRGYRHSMVAGDAAIPARQGCPACPELAETAALVVCQVEHRSARTKAGEATLAKRESLQVMERQVSGANRASGPE
jgi:hypothetical protein